MKKQVGSIDDINTLTVRNVLTSPSLS